MHSKIVREFLKDNGISVSINERGETVITKGKTSFTVLSDQGLKITARIAELISDKHNLMRFLGVHLRSELHRVAIEPVPFEVDEDKVAEYNNSISVPHPIWDEPKTKGNFFDNMDRYSGKYANINAD